MPTIESKRATGRTTRMLNEAARLIRLGRPVYIVCASWDHAAAFRESMPADVAHKCIFMSSQDPRINWESMRVLGPLNSGSVMFDHHAIEQRYGRMLNMWVAFDDEVEDPEGSTLPASRGSGERWQAVVRKDGGKTIRKTFDRKADAESWARKEY